MVRRTSKRQRFKGLKEGWRSGLEKKVGGELREIGVPFTYETLKIEYSIPSKKHKYTPDFIIEGPDGTLIIETKGRFTAHDRKKHILIKEQRPEFDIRFVFSNSNTKIYKGSKTSYASWCQKHGFQYSDKSIPRKWIEEVGIDEV